MEPFLEDFKSCIGSSFGIAVDGVECEISILEKQINEVKDDKFKCHRLLNELILKKIDLQQKHIKWITNDYKFSVDNPEIMTMRDLALGSIPLKEQAQARKKGNAKEFRNHQVQQIIRDQLEEISKITKEIKDQVGNFLTSNSIRCHGPLCTETKATKTLRKCAGCQKALYCSKECQKNDWKEAHKLICKKTESI